MRVLTIIPGALAGFLVLAFFGHLAAGVRRRMRARRSDFVATASNVRASAVEALRAAGIGLPDPGRYVVEPGRSTRGAPRSARIGAVEGATR